MKYTDTEPPVQYAFPQLEILHLYVGPWDFVENHFDSRGQITGTVNGREDIGWALNHRAIRRSYESTSPHSAYQAVGTVTWNDVEKKYYAVWFDDSSPANPTVSRGTWDSTSKTMLFEFDTALAGGKSDKYRVVERFVDESNRVATTYQVVGTVLIKRTEVEYRRSKPCPDSLRIIFDK